MKFLRKFFLGYVVLEKIESSFNGKIEVRDNLFGGKTLVSGGISQSGKRVEDIWRKGLNRLKDQKTDPPTGGLKNILVLGLGAGSIAQLIAKLYPESSITGVEIDPEIIRLGEKYFAMSQIKNLKIMNKNAFTCFNDLYGDFDLVAVDLYVGMEYPKEGESKMFMENIEKILNKNGTIIFNRLYYGKEKEKTEEFGQKLKKFFIKIEAKKIGFNKLFLCQN